MNLSQEEIEMVLEAGLEKVAYEEGLNDYAQSLEKVAGVHGVDAMELHDFLETAGEMEKEAADERTELSEEGYKKLRNANMLAAGGGGALLGGLAGGSLAGGKGALVGAGTGAALNAGSAAAGTRMGKGLIKRLANMEDGGKIKNTIRDYEKNMVNKYNEKAEKKKTASAYGLDEDTFDALFNAGVEALSE